MSPGALALGEGDSTLLYVAEGHAVSAFDAGTLHRSRRRHALRTTADEFAAWHTPAASGGE